MNVGSAMTRRARHDPERVAILFEDRVLAYGELDVGAVDEDSDVSIVDRVKDMSNVSGFKVWPAEVEEALYSHHAVLEAAVYGGPDPARVLAAVTLRRGFRAMAVELTAYLETRLAKYKRPEAIDVVDRLPKGPTGKILKRDLRADVRRDQPRT